MTRRCRLYLLTPPRIADVDAFAAALEGALAAGDVAAVQIRLKDVDANVLRQTVERLVPIIQAGGAAAILNDHPDLAVQTGCDGAHIGQQDMPYAEARRRLGPRRMIGVTCHDSRHLAMEAADAGADYVAFGAFFPTGTKTAPTMADPDILTVWQETMQTPCVAIGGITADNAAVLARAGADFVAVSAGVWRYREGPEAAVRAINAALEQAQVGD